MENNLVTENQTHSGLDDKLEEASSLKNLYWGRDAMFNMYSSELEAYHQVSSNWQVTFDQETRSTFLRKVTLPSTWKRTEHLPA